MKPQAKPFGPRRIPFAWYLRSWASMSLPVAAADPLPQTAPIPSRNPVTQDEALTAPSNMPAPSPRPGGDRSQQEEQTSPKSVETPSPHPKADEASPPGPDIDAPEPDAKPRLVLPPRPATSPAEEAACRQRLTAMGASFAEQPPISDPNGCAMPHPISLSALEAGSMSSRRRWSTVPPRRRWRGS